MMRDFDELRQLQSSVRGVGEFSRRAHLRAESSLIAELQATRPNYGFRCRTLGNEDGKDPTRYWIVSAPDGSRNFSHGVPYWSIMLALEFKGVCGLALVFDVISNDLFAAEKGGGSWLNESRMRVSARTRPAEMLAAVELPDGNHETVESGQSVARILGNVGGIRSFGAPSLGLAYLAAGRIDGYCNGYVGKDEIAGGTLLVAEAGGLTRLTERDHNSGAAIIAACGSAFDAFAAIVDNPV